MRAVNQRDGIIRGSLLSLAKELQVEEHSRTHRRRHQCRERDNSRLGQGVLRGQSLDAERREVS